MILLNFGPPQAQIHDATLNQIENSIEASMRKMGSGFQ